MITYVHFTETFRADRTQSDWEQVPMRDIIRLDDYDDIKKLKGKKVFFISPKDAERLSIKYTELGDYKHPKKAYYIFGRNKPISRVKLQGLSEWVKENKPSGDIVGLGHAKDKISISSSQTAKNVIVDMKRKNVNSSSSKTHR